MEPTPVVVQLLPLWTAIAGALAGLAALPVAERLRRVTLRTERVRQAVGNALRIINNAALSEQTDNAFDEWVVALATAGYEIEIEMRGYRANFFHGWWDAQTKKAIRAWDSRAENRFTKVLERFADNLADLYRRNFSMLRMLNDVQKL